MKTEGDECMKDGKTAITGCRLLKGGGVNITSEIEYKRRVAHGRCIMLQGVWGGSGGGERDTTSFKSEMEDEKGNCVRSLLDFARSNREGGGEIGH